MSSCEPSSNNLPLYFQSILPSISPVSPNNTILYATTGSLPSYTPLNRIWNFICNGTFSGLTASVLFDARELIEKCPQYNISFEGKLNGQLTFQTCNYQLQKYVTYSVVKNESGRITGVVFDITKPHRLHQDKTYEFYFNIFLNDIITYNISLTYDAQASGSFWSYDGNGGFVTSKYNCTELTPPTCPPIIYLFITTVESSQCGNTFQYTNNTQSSITMVVYLISQQITANSEYVYNNSDIWMPTAPYDVTIDYPTSNTITGANYTYSCIAGFAGILNITSSVPCQYGSNNMYITFTNIPTGGTLDYTSDVSSVTVYANGTPITPSTVEAYCWTDKLTFKAFCALDGPRLGDYGKIQFPNCFCFQWIESIFISFSYEQPFDRLIPKLTTILVVMRVTTTTALELLSSRKISLAQIDFLKYQN